VAILPFIGVIAGIHYYSGSAYTILAISSGRVGHGGDTPFVTRLPTGTVTFLLTDIESSTRRWEREPDAMRSAVAQHDVLFERAVAAHSGIDVKPRGEGDSHFSVFPRATDAVVAAAEFQQVLSAASWPTESPLRVRIGIHTGEADLRDGDYYGSTVNRCARLRSLAWGSQTLVSLATMQLVRENLPDGLDLRDLGQHRLKDLSFPEHVFQLVIPGVPDDFPPLLSLDRLPTNLPIQATPFIGRKHEIEIICSWLLDSQTRLVTLTGPGGSGKTRLGLQVGASIIEHFPDGVYFVPLESVSDPSIVIQSIAHVIGVRETTGVGLTENLSALLQDKTMLLVLDNFERLISASGQVAALLASNPGLKILVTSREVLRIQGEHELLVPPLAFPDETLLLSPERLMDYEAIRLFVSRATEVKPDFELTAENAAAVLGICQRLDGLPLAIELAAARIRMFPPQALLKRLDRTLTLLTGGARDLPLRHQTLRGTIAWSYDLLVPDEQGLFRCLSVFAGGFTLDGVIAVTRAAEAEQADMPVEPPVQGEEDLWARSIEVFDGIDALLSKSLVHRQRSSSSSDGEPRFGMLETIREFGLDQLEASGELNAVRRNHAEYCMTLAEQAEPALQGPEQGEWLQRLEDEHRNMRAAMNYALDTLNAELGLRLTSALWPFWEIRGYLTEGRSWTERMLTLGGPAPWRARTLTGAGTFAWYQGDYERAAQLHGEALQLYQGLDDVSGIAFATSNLGLQNVGLGNLETAAGLFNEAMSLYEKISDESGIADIYSNLAVIEFYTDQYDRAAELFEKSLFIRRKLGDKQRIADALHNLGEIYLFQEDCERAVEYYRETLCLRQELGASTGTGLSFAAMSFIELEQGNLELSARLTGAADALFEVTGGYMDPTEQARYEETRHNLIARLGEAPYESLREEGFRTPLEEAVQLAAGHSGSSGDVEREQQSSRFLLPD
jgi:predicted ATPase/class 3 adenylate cyclase